MKTFKEQLLNDIIPRLRMMILKEEQHLSWLYKKWSESGMESDRYFDFFYNATDTSKKYLNNFNIRLQQYIDYAAKL